MLDTCDSGAFVLASRAPTATRAAIDRLMQSTGRVILAGAGNQQMALEGYQGHGYFSYAVITGLGGKADLDRDKTILISELATFLDMEVPRITGEKQHPMKDDKSTSFPIGLAP